jgi:hypothetical protein
MRGLVPVALALLTVAGAGADQFQLGIPGVSPIVMEAHFQLVANGKNVEPLTGRVFKRFPAHEVRLTTLKVDPAARAANYSPASPPPPPSKLQPIQKVFVDQLDGNNGPMVREQVMALLANSGRFRSVDDPKTADATIKGRAQARKSAAETASANTGDGSAGGVVIGRAILGGGEQ